MGLDNLLKSLSKDTNTRGNQFERISKWYFLNNPKWSMLVEEAWLWDEWPERWGPDSGIDLILKFKDGTIWAVQAKCYDEKYSITKKDVDTFFSESSRELIYGRILVATTNEIGSRADSLFNS